MKTRGNRLDAIKARLADRFDCGCGDPACPYYPADLRWLVREVDRLRHIVRQRGRRGLPLCQVAHCHTPVSQVVEIELPMAWEGSAEYTALTVVVGACARHGHDMARRVHALLEARADYPNLLTIIERATVEEAHVRADRDGMRTRVQALQAELASTQRERDGAERALCEQRDRAARAERALSLIEGDPGLSVAEAEAAVNAGAGGGQAA